MYLLFFLIILMQFLGNQTEFPLIFFCLFFCLQCQNTDIEFVRYDFAGLNLVLGHKELQFCGVSTVKDSKVESTNTVTHTYIVHTASSLLSFIDLIGPCLDKRQETRDKRIYHSVYAGSFC
ncbi:hypothetical protein ACOSP7_020176 [Xanthoceras sorbifolium]